MPPRRPLANRISPLAEGRFDRNPILDRAGLEANEFLPHFVNYPQQNQRLNHCISFAIVWLNSHEFNNIAAAFRLKSFFSMSVKGFSGKPPSKPAPIRITHDPAANECFPHFWTYPQENEGLNLCISFTSVLPNSHGFNDIAVEIRLSLLFSTAVIAPPPRQHS